MKSVRKLCTKEFLSMLATGSIIAVLAVGCGSGQKAEESSLQQGKALQTIQPADLNLVGIDDERTQTLLQQRFPQIHFTFYKTNKPSLQELIAGGTNIDMVSESYGAFAAPGYALSLGLQNDMTELAKQSRMDLNRFEPSSVEGIKEYGGLYGIPYNISAFVVYYNKDIFDKFGVPYPKDGMTWDEMNDLSKKLTRMDNGQQYIGFIPLDLGHLFVDNQLSVPYVDPKTGKAAIGTMDWEEKWKKLFQTYEVNYFTNPEYKAYVNSKSADINGRTVFQKNRTAAMLLDGASVDNKNLEGMNWDMVSAPTFSDQPKVGFQPYPGYLCVTSTSKHKDVDMEIIKYLTSDELQTQNSKLGVITSLNSDTIRKVYGQESPSKDKNLQAVFYNKFAPMPKATMYDQMVQRAYVKALLPVLTGETDMNTAFRNAAETAEQAIEDIKKEGINTNLK